MYANPLRLVTDAAPRKDSAFHERVRHGYREIAREDPERFVVIDASAPVAEVAARVQAVVFALLP